MSLIETKIYYSPEGVLQSQEFLRNGKLEGERKAWYSDGQLLEHEFFRDGKCEGARRIWHRNGQLSISEIYLDGKREGKTEYWDDQGRIETRGFCRNGYREGCHKFWCSDGSIYAHVIYNEGESRIRFRYFPDTIQRLDWMICDYLFSPMKPSYNFSFQKRQILFRLKTKLQKILNRGKNQMNSLLITDLCSEHK